MLDRTPTYRLHADHPPSVSFGVEPKPLSLARHKPLSGLQSLLRVRGSRTAPSVTPLVSLFVSKVQPVASVLTKVNVSEPIYRRRQRSDPRIRADDQRCR